MGVEGEGTGDAVCDWAMEDEVQCAELGKGVALHRAFDERGEVGGDALLCDSLFEQREVVFAEGDKGDGDDVSFVAGAGVCELVEKPETPTRRCCSPRK